MNETVQPVLRPATDSDFELAYSIKKAAFKHYVDQQWGLWDEEFQRERHAEEFDPSQAQIITYQGAEVGWLALRREQQHIDVTAIYISPEYQNRRIGSFLLRQVLLEARDKRVPVKLGVLKVNPRARKLYESLGFRPVSETDTHYLMKAFP